MTDWDDAFDNVGYIPNALSYFDMWQARATAFRRDAQAELAIPYGPGDRQILDIFWPETDARGLVIFIHGGYWTKLDRTFFSDLAAGPLAHGLAVALPSYTLAPAVRVSEITLEIAQAIACAAAHVTGPIRLAGHSAGGHLVTRMISDKALLPDTIQSRIAKTVSISGLHDLRNLCKSKLNNSLQLMAEEAAQESSWLATPFSSSNVTCWVGGDERPEFIRQSHLLQSAWQKTCRIDTFVEPDRHHFNVIDGLKDPNAPLMRSLLA
jgi:acetyl esterase/lipase